MVERFKEQLTSVAGWVRRQATQNPLGALLILIVSGLLVFIVWETARRDFLGFDDKKLWDWMDLLIVPIVLAIGAWWFNKTERASDRKIAEERVRAEREIAEDRQQETRLQTYFDRMTELLLEKGLRESDPEDEQRSIARTRTLTALRTLDETRKGILLEFLQEAGLIAKDRAVISLSGADLSGANLFGADLTAAFLSAANLSGAFLDGSDLNGADLRGTFLNGAEIANEQISQARLLQGATMPDGTVYEEWVRNHPEFLAMRGGTPTVEEEE